MLELFFWLNVFIVVYTYVGYGLILLVLNTLFFRKNQLTKIKNPEVSILIAAYNEEDWIVEKINNTLSLDYPAELLKVIVITDGSTDKTFQKAKSCTVPAGISFEVYHQPERKGKLAAIERIMPLVKTPVAIFTDANTVLNRQAIRQLVCHYNHPKVGAVAGEKRVSSANKDEASSAGEGIYWKYESLLKRWDANLYSAVGAAGELFSIRTALYESIPADTLIEDFYLTMTVLRKGYRIAYAADAYASEGASASVGEELKRKIRIAAGGIQASWRLRDLLNPFRYGVFSWQFFSHKVLRWTLAPLALPIVFLLNLFLAFSMNPWYVSLFILQILFYLLALLGWIFEKKQIKIKAFFIPYYFCVMNFSVFLGFARLLKNQQTVLWEKAERKRNQ
ncbi:MAG: glycosyltransferase family 2 protein [Haliscomenobacter sp.]|uniref:glycosyltransferase family 2 protein n=1 Tax=Haliscomenobacter sp. TaxID=2717303 RepID=UPI0029B67058|nr:glycosyltransferase family 2 protein [Haliscomenobacter sp.]MDX2066804.1 glycosyltransferase family 2 protein [Haliscomenobacter sp.]